MVKNIIQYHQNVEIMWKSTCKSPCNSRVNFCAKFTTSHPLCAKLAFSTNFSFLSHPLSHSPLTSVVQLFYPLFHSPYYYNYL